MTTPTLTPKPGFNYAMVSWGAPERSGASSGPSLRGSSEDQQRTLFCSYCDAPFGDDEVPLMQMIEPGWLAEFCEDCACRWFGIERLA